MARACGSYPQCRWFKSDYRYHRSSNRRSNSGPMVKRLRHRPFTAVTRVRFPFGSPLYGRIAQLVRAPASHAGGQRFESVYAHQIKAVHSSEWAAFILCTKTDSCRCLLERPSGLSVAARNARCRGHKRFESVYAHQLRTVHTSVWAVLNLCVITEPMPLPPRKAVRPFSGSSQREMRRSKRFELRSRESLNG